MLNDYNRPVKVDIIGGLEDRLMGCVGFILVVGLICVVLQKIVLPVLFVVLALIAVAIPVLLWMGCMAYISSKKVDGPKSPFWFLSANAAAEHLKAFVQKNYRGSILSIEVERPFESDNFRYMLVACVELKGTGKTAELKKRIFLCSWSCEWTEIELRELKDYGLFHLFPQLRDTN